MPYTIVERDGQFCVHKLENEQPAGEALGCHDTREGAAAQIGAIEASEADKIKATTTIKALSDDRIGGYLVVYGSPQQKDLQGEYFTPDTDFKLDWFPVRPALYHHGLDARMKSSHIGKIDTLTPDDVGLWAEAQLDLHNEYVEAVRDLIKKGALSWSSGSVPHLVEVERDGKIKAWPLIEGSATPSPAEPRKTEIAVIKAAYKELGLDTSIFDRPDETPTEPIPAGVPEVGQGAKEPEGAKEPQASDGTGVNVSEQEQQQEDNELNTHDVVAMTVDAVIQALQANVSDEEKMALVEQIVAGLSQQEDNMDAARSSEVATEVAPVVAKAVADFIAQREVARKAVSDAANGAVKNVLAAARPQSKLNGGSSVDLGNGKMEITTYSKYHHMNAEDMSYYAWALQQFSRHRQSISPTNALTREFFQEFADKAGKAYTGNKMILDSNAIKSINGIKADELNYSTLASGGDEWVPDAWSNQVWERARLDNVIFPLFRSVDMPANPYELPIDSTDPTVYFVPETTNENQLLISGSGNPIPDSKMATGKVTLTAKKLALRVGFSAEVEEDSIIPFIPQLRTQAIRAMEDAIDHVLLNGDTTNAATGNINLDDADPADTEKYLIFDGLRHFALVDGTATSVDAGNTAPTVADIRTTRFSMAIANATQPNNIVYIVDGSSYAKMLGMDEVITLDKYGPQATVLTGEIGRLDGSPVLVSNEMGLTEADGKKSTTASNNTLGQLACVYTPNFTVGFRRRVAPVIEFLSWADAYQMTATVRLAFENRDLTSVTVLYNLAV